MTNHGPPSRNISRGIIAGCLFALVLAAGIATLGGCSFLDQQADDRLGIACTDQVRVDRASKFTALMAVHYGDNHPSLIADLWTKVKKMDEAAVAGSGIDAAGDAYKFTFVRLALAVAAKHGIKVALGGMGEAIAWLKSLPDKGAAIAAGINIIEADTQIACAKVTGPPKDLRAALDRKGGA